MPVIKEGILVTDYGQEYLVTVNEPSLNGSPRMVVSKKTSIGWDTSSVTPMAAIRAKALAVMTINRLFSAICQQGV